MTINRDELGNLLLNIFGSLKEQGGGYPPCLSGTGRQLVKQFIDQVAEGIENRPTVKYTLDKEFWPESGDRIHAVPQYKTHGASGVDLVAAEHHIVKAHGGRAFIHTGLRVEIPPGFEGQVRPRSGFAKNYGVTITNAPGTVDSDFRGSMMVMLINHGLGDFEVKKGDRIAQLIIARSQQANFIEAEELSNTDRGEGGFGSTGK